jgi:chaperone modulatory protein CbpM
MAYPLVYTAPARMSLDTFAATAGIHPDLLRRLVRLGLLDPYVDAAGRLWFPPAQLARLARAQRLRAALGLNYAALGLVLDLLTRIDELETTLRARRTQEWS